MTIILYTVRSLSVVSNDPRYLKKNKRNVSKQIKSHEYVFYKE